jgi:2-isopropylmalate synthase
MQLLQHEVSEGDDAARLTARLLVDGDEVSVTGSGNGPIAAFIDALERDLGYGCDILDYAEHAISAGHEANAASYVELTDSEGTTRWGVGIDHSISSASLKAVVSAINHRAGQPGLSATLAARARARGPVAVATRPPGGP